MAERRMTMLTPRHIDAREAARLGVASGWYGTKASGAFVLGPHPTEETCLKDIQKVGPIAQDQVRG